MKTQLAQASEFKNVLDFVDKWVIENYSGPKAANTELYTAEDKQFKGWSNRTLGLVFLLKIEAGIVYFVLNDIKRSLPVFCVPVPSAELDFLALMEFF